MILAQITSFLLLWTWYFNNYVAACKLIGYYLVKSFYAQISFYIITFRRLQIFSAYECCK